METGMLWCVVSLTNFLLFLTFISCQYKEATNLDIVKKNNGRKTFLTRCSGCHRNVSGDAPSITEMRLEDFRTKMGTLSSNSFVHKTLSSTLSDVDIQHLIYYIRFEKSNQVKM